MSDKLGFAIVGCGMIARFHVAALAEIPGARVAALVSRTPASAEKLLDETGTPAVPGLRHGRGGGEGPGRGRGHHHHAERGAPRTRRRRRGGRQARRRREAAGDHRRPRCDRIIDACDTTEVKLCTIFPSRFADANAGAEGRGRRRASSAG